MKSIVLIAVLWVIGATVHGAVINASSTSLLDVSNAVLSATSGDTVAIPAGNSTWAGTLTVTKAITISGAGTNSTTISGTDLNLIFINGVSGAFRMTALSLSNNATSVYSLVRVRNSRPFRIDRCRFDYGVRQISVEQYSEGLIDRNTFVNGDISVGFTMDGSTSWGRPIVPGTTNTVVIESNAFRYNAAMVNSQDHTIYHQDGGRSVTRFNSFDSSAMTGQSTAWFDSHGNWNTGTIVDPASTDALQTRGQPLIEVYGNSWNAHNSYGAMGIRGGSMLFFSNSIVEMTTTPYLRLTEEEGWQTAFYSPLRTTWPAHDGHTNTFIWANTVNGSAMTTVDRPNASDVTLIQENRDYWMQAPNATNGSPAGVYSSYLPLTYPHPRATAEDTPAGPTATVGSATAGTLLIGP